MAMIDAGPSIGGRFDRYEIEALLGEGGMGTVYRARDPRLRRSVALKVVRSRAGASAAARADAAARLIREARAAAALNHPNAVAIYDVGAHEGQAFVAMELVEGQSLRGFIGDASVAVLTRLRWIRDVARALSAAHARGLVHRDVKPANVMVRSDGVVKVLDFGIARRTRFVATGAAGETLTGDENELTFAPIAPNASKEGDEGPASSETLGTLTRAGSVVGTPLYMAPEQMRGEPVDARADQFAWGVLAYELLTGNKPWGDEPTLRTFAAMTSTPPPPLAERAPDVPPTVIDAVHRALAVAPQERHRSMDELLAVLDGEPGEAGVRPAPGRGAPQEARPTTNLTAASEQASSFARTSRPTRVVATLAVIGAVSVVGWLVFRAAVRARAPLQEPLAVSAPSPVAPRPTTVTDLPVPASTSPEALAAYREGLRAQRDGSVVASRAAFERATAEDPALAAGWLRLSILLFWSDNPTEARAAWAKVGPLTDRLDAHDTALARCFEAVVVNDPLDWDEYIARLRDASTQFPLDGEIVNHYAYALYRNARWREAADVYARAIAIDPQQAEQYRFGGIARARMGDLDGARAMADACDRGAPSSPMCPQLRVPIDEQSGDCARLEQDGRQIVVRNDGATGFVVVAEALASQGRDAESVREALRLDTEATPPAARRHHGVFDDLKLAMWQGDFASAERLAQELDALDAAEVAEEEHAKSAEAIVQIYLETGRPRDARAAAQRFLDRRSSWISHTVYTTSGVSRAVVPEMLAAVRAGGGDPVAFARARDAWVADWRAHADAPTLAGLWYPAYAAIAESRDDAYAADGARGAFEPMQLFLPGTLGHGYEGWVRFLAGDVARALPGLEQGAAACLCLMRPVEHVRMLWRLGVAREANGDVAGACAAYGKVLSRWGAAKPRSVTAEQARARVSALGCKT
jgi:serine/threonine-protein kinase